MFVLTSAFFGSSRVYIDSDCSQLYKPGRNIFFFSKFFTGVSFVCFFCAFSVKMLVQIQSTLVISKSKGPSKKLRDIRTSTNQMCSSEEKNNLNNQKLQMTM